MTSPPKPASTCTNGPVGSAVGGVRHWIQDHPDARFATEKGRYHLYLALACPFATRCFMALRLKGLDDWIDCSIVHPVFQRTRPQDPNDLHLGWAFVDPQQTPWLPGPTGIGQYSSAGSTVDKVYGVRFVRDLYEKAGVQTSRFTVPILWDKKTHTIVSNESADILCMLNRVFPSFASSAPCPVELCSPQLEDQIKDLNDWIDSHIMMNVYKSGFAKTQREYEASCTACFAALDQLEQRLQTKRFLCGHHLTECDLRLFSILIRFDEVYTVLFKTNKRLLMEYHCLFNYLKDIYQLPGIASTVNMDHIRLTCFGSKTQLNPNGIIPLGRNVDYSTPHDRLQLV